MKTLTTISLALAVAAAGAQTTSQSQIRHIETSLNLRPDVDNQLRAHA